MAERDPANSPADVFNGGDAGTRRRFLAAGAALVSAAALALGAGVLTSCKDGGAEVQAPAKPLVVCSIFAYYDAARAIGADSVDVKLMLPPQTSPHEYQGTTADTMNAAKAALYIKNGMGLDDHLDKMFEGRSAKVLNISQEIPQEMILKTAEVSLDAPATRPAGTAAATQKDNADEALPNPHIWLDPMVQIKAAELIRDALSLVDPKNKTIYAVNAKTYMAELYELDENFKSATATFKTKEFIGFHSAYEYLAHRYGLKQIASIEELPGIGLSPAQAVRIENLIRDKKIKYIAIETGLAPTGIDLIQRDTGVKTITLQPLETYDSISDTYISLMKENLEALKKALE